MNGVCLGGAGKICGEAARDLVEFSEFEKITIGDYNEAAGRALVEEMNDSRVDFVKVNVLEKEETINTLREYDIVMDGTTIKLNDRTTECIARAGCSGINLNGFGEEYKYDDIFKMHGKIHVPGFGMTPGTTDMMVRYVADRLDTVEIVRVSHGAFRPIAFSPSITETTTYEYDPDLAGRVVFEDGKFIQVPPFARERDIELPEPYGTHPQWIIPHSETRTAYEYLKDKGIRLIEVRGTWPPANMALHVEIIGTKAGKKYRHVLTHTHPSSDGSVEGWEGLRAYTRCVGIPLSIGVQLIARGRAHGTGAVMPEFAFDPADVFSELEKRRLCIHEVINEL